MDLKEGTFASEYIDHSEFEFPSPLGVMDLKGLSDEALPGAGSSGQIPRGQFWVRMTLQNCLKYPNKMAGSWMSQGLPRGLRSYNIFKVRLRCGSFLPTNNKIT